MTLSRTLGLAVAAALTLIVVVSPAALAGPPPGQEKDRSAEDAQAHATRTALGGRDLVGDTGLDRQVPRVGLAEHQLADPRGLLVGDQDAAVRHGRLVAGTERGEAQVRAPRERAQPTDAHEQALVADGLPDVARHEIVTRGDAHEGLLPLAPHFEHGASQRLAAHLESVTAPRESDDLVGERFAGALDLQGERSIVGA